METNVVIGLTIGALIVLAIIVWILWLVLRALFSELAKQDLFFTRREEGQIKYLTEGGRLIRIIEKIEGHKINPKTFIVEPDPDNTTERRSFSEWLWGVYWKGFPPREIKRYPLVWKRPLRPDDIEKAQDPEKRAHYDINKKYGLVTRSDETTYHLWKSVYSIFIENIEIKGVKMKVEGNEIQGTIQINFFGTFNLVTVNAYLPVMVLNGQWFPHIEDGIRGIIADFFSDKDIDEIRNMAKATAKETTRQRSELEQRIIDFSEAPGGTIATTGLRIEAFNYGGFDLSRPEILQAVEKRAIAQLSAAARIEEGRGEGEYRRQIGEGEAAGIAAKVGAIGSNQIAADVLSHQFKAEGMKGLRGTYVEGGGTQGTLLPLPPNPTDPRPSPAPAQPSDPKPQTEEEEDEDKEAPTPTTDPVALSGVNVQKVTVTRKDDNRPKKQR